MKQEEINKEIKGLLLKDYYRNTYLAHYNTSFTPDTRAVTTIKEFSELLESDLVELGDKQGNYRKKLINKTIRKCSGENFESQVYRSIIDLGFSEDTAEKISKPDVCGSYGFESFQLRNNNAKIKRLKQKVMVMKNRIARKSEWEDVTFEGGRATIEDDRLKIYHDEKPSRHIINEIKQNGFRWSPHWGCWCRKHTGNAINSLKDLSFIQNASS